MIGKFVTRHGLLLIFFLFLGCASAKTTDTRFQEEISHFQEAKLEVTERMTSLQQENQDIRKRMDGFQAELHTQAEQLSLLRDDAKNSKPTPQPLASVPSGKEKVLRDAATEQTGISNSALLEKELPPADESVRRQSSYQTAQVNVDKRKLPAPTDVRKEKQKSDENPAKSLRIKVLSGNGDRSSARKMAQKINLRGYPVELIDMAPRSNFSDPIIYYAPSHQKEAEKLATELGKLTIIKPLTWPSSFNLIVVTGKENTP